MDLGDRRQRAVLELLAAAKKISDRYRLCPVCLMLTVAEAVQISVASGEMEHFENRHAREDEENEGVLQ